MVFLFNVGGYYIVFWALKHQASEELSARLDAELYAEEETIELKIPVSLPYPLQETGSFERMNGMFEHRGEFYKLVKQKLQNDTLYIVCIQDHERKHLENTMTDYVKLSNDLPGTNSQKALQFLGKLLKDYDSNSAITFTEQPGWSMSISYKEISDSFNTPSIQIQSPPPKA
jgi:hypothetical protein